MNPSIKEIVSFIGLIFVGAGLGFSILALVDLFSATLYKSFTYAMENKILIASISFIIGGLIFGILKVKE